MSKPEQAELREKLSKLNSSGAHACYCGRSTDKGCECALKDEYVEEIVIYFEQELLKARIDSVQLYMDTCEKGGVPPSWRNLREFQRGQQKAFAVLSQNRLTGEEKL